MIEPRHRAAAVFVALIALLTACSSSSEDGPTAEKTSSSRGADASSSASATQPTIGKPPGPGCGAVTTGTPPPGNDIIKSEALLYVNGILGGTSDFAQGCVYRGTIPQSVTLALARMSYPGGLGSGRLDDRATGPLGKVTNVVYRLENYTFTVRVSLERDGALWITGIRVTNGTQVVASSPKGAF